MENLKPKQFGRLTVLHDRYVWHGEEGYVLLTPNEVFALDTAALLNPSERLAEQDMRHTMELLGYAKGYGIYKNGWARGEEMRAAVRYIRKHWEWTK